MSVSEHSIFSQQLPKPEYGQRKQPRLRMGGEEGSAGHGGGDGTSLPGIDVGLIAVETEGGSKTPPDQELL